MLINQQMTKVSLDISLQQLTYLSHLIICSGYGTFGRCEDIKDLSDKHLINIIIDTSDLYRCSITQLGRDLHAAIRQDRE